MRDTNQRYSCTAGAPHDLRAVAHSIDAAAHAIECDAPEAMESLQAALREVVALYPMGLAAEDIECLVARAARMHWKCGSGGHSEVTRCKIGLLKEAAALLRQVI